MFIATAIFSLANTVGYNSVKPFPPPNPCGGFSNDNSPDTIAFGQGLWFGGKFAMVTYEFFIMAVSVNALRTGATAMSRRNEIGAHCVCAAVGFLFFTLYFVTVRRLKSEEAAMMQEVRTATSLAQANKLATKLDQRVREDGDWIMTGMQAWCGLLGVVLAAWGYLRYLFTQLLAEWEDGLKEASADWDRDLWVNDEYNRGQRAKKRLLLDVRKEALAEVAKPLEPYIVVFIAFGIPAIVMATDWCNDQTEAVMLTDERLTAMRPDLRAGALVPHPRDRPGLLCVSRAPGRALRCPNAWLEAVATLRLLELHLPGGL
jgi:hypothetical protein